MRTRRDIIRTCWYPEVRFQKPYEVESSDGVDQTRGWLLEIEWLGFLLQIAGGMFHPKKEG